MKKLIKLMLCALLMVTFMGACAKGGDDATVGTMLAEEFKDCYEGKTILEVAETLSTSENLPFSGIAMEVHPGLLTGFDNYEVTGFKKGAMFAPMMGTIPFVGYVFELDETTDVETFKTNLEDNANLRWNICTEAEEITVTNEGKIVFFLMAPKAFEEE